MATTDAAQVEAEQIKSVINFTIHKKSIEIYKV